MAKIIESEDIIIKTDCGFKQALVLARGQKNIKQIDFARKLGIKETELKAFESGSRLPNNSLISKME